ncbi:ammonium transporter [Nocardioides sp.]|uniref:ammonium transporter n=1 Tax=Nocardioides sp. TaxID=35761 RepID=UPI002612ACA5|nr:ammonium transporter [Nocardioides sp.]
MDGYYAWMIMATALVLMMTTPALALFYGGMTRSKSVLNMMMMSYLSMGVIGLVYVLWGWSESFGTGGTSFFANPFSLFGLDGVTSEGGGYIAVAFQLTFAVITAALISGAVADRVKISSWVVFIVAWVTLCYFPMAHMVWGGGFINQHWAPQDYAGGTVVHINAGVAGGILALIVGRRIGFKREAMKPHSLPLTMIGAGLLWFGWYGFNVGSIVFPAGASEADKVKQFISETGFTFLTTTVATCAAMLAWLIVERLIHGKATSLGAASGIVAGLVAITPATGAVQPVGAIAIGAIAGAVCAWAVSLKYRFNLDDSLDVVGVHLVGGVLGTLLIGLFSSAKAPGGINGLFYGGGLGSLGDQFMGVLIAVVWTGVITTLLALAIKYTMGWRVSEEAEVEGIDSDQHGETAYDIAGGSGVLS